CWEHWQPRYDGFVERYNQVRPHEALGMQRPAQIYRPSPRRYKVPGVEWEYPSGLEIQRLDERGFLRLEGKRYFICEALSGQSVAWERVGTNVLVRFRQMYLRELNLLAGTALSFIHPLSQIDGQVLPMS